MSDTQLKGVNWLSEFIQNLFDNGALGDVKLIKLQELIGQN